MSELKKVEIFTDGACSGNPGPGGWGAVLRYGEHEAEMSGGDANTTNNRMNRGGGAGVVLMSLDEYNSIKETEYLMKSPENVKRIKAAEQEIRDGKGKVIAPEDIWK